MAIRTFFSFLLLFVAGEILAQQPLFYARSNRSMPLDFATQSRNCFSFIERDIVYNNIITVLENEILIQQEGLYELSSFVNINLGTSAGRQDSLQLTFSIVKNPHTTSEEILFETAYVYRYGNFDVAAGLQIQPFYTTLRREDEICLCVTQDFGTFEINANTRYHHISTPTGMPQIMGLRIEKIN